MKAWFWINLALVATAAVLYLYWLVRRTVSLFVKKIPWWGKLLIFVGLIVVGILTARNNVGVTIAHIALLALVFELINLLIKLISRGKVPKAWVVIFRSNILPIVLAVVWCVYGSFNMKNVVRTSYSVTADNLSDSYRVVLLSDLHYPTAYGAEELSEVLGRIQEEKPDLVILSGDLVDESTTKAEMQEAFSLLGGVSSTFGTYYVYGNHDRQPGRSTRLYSDEELKETIEQNGITILQDSYVQLNEELVILGRDDIHRNENRKEVSEVIGSAAEGKYLIVTEHQPRDFAAVEQAGTSLFVAGHTHRGQIFPAGAFIQWQDQYDLWYGYERYGNMDAIVTSGVAGWGYSFRTEGHSEYVVIDINGAS